MTHNADLAATDRHLHGQECDRCGHPYWDHFRAPSCRSCGCNADPACSLCGQLTSKHIDYDYRIPPASTEEADRG